MKALFILLIFLPIALQGKTLTIGQVYPVVESDFRDSFQNEKIEKKLKNYDVRQSSALKGYALSYNDKESVLDFIPFYSIQFDVYDKEGNILYPKGYTFNIAEYITLPNRIIVFDENQIDFVNNHYQQGDHLILDNGDIFTVKEKLKKPVFILESGYVDRYKLIGTPTIVEQIDQQFRRSNYVY